MGGSMVKLCECGCGTAVKNRFVSGHNVHGSQNPNWRGGSNCQCGCGQRCRHQRKYLPGHEPRKISDHGDGYLTVHDGEKHSLQHRVIVERVLKCKLPDSVEVHHVDGDRSHNWNSNLVVCQDRAYHQLLHRRERAYRACGHADWKRCTTCGTWDSPDNLYTSSNGRGSTRHRGGCRKHVTHA